MAYGLKYTIPWKDVDNNDNLIEIYQDGFVGSSTELIGTDTPAVHRYEREDNEDLLSPIMSSILTISFYSTESVNFTNFFSYSDTEFLVYYKFRNVTYFKGYLLNDITGEPFQDPPYPVVLTATDGLAQLKQVQLTGPDTDTELGLLIIEQLNRLGLELNLEIVNDLYEGLVQDNTISIFSQLPDNQLKVQAGTFDEVEMTAYEFLKEICKSFGWVLYQRASVWFIQRPIWTANSTATKYLHSYVDGSLISSSTNAGFDYIADQDYTSLQWIPVNADQLLQYQRPIKKLTIKQGDLGQDIIANGENFRESSWYLDGSYKPTDWTVTPDPNNLPIQIYPNNIPAQSSWNDEEGVSWDIRFMPNGSNTDEPIISKPVFLDFAGLSLDLEVNVDYLTSVSGLAFTVAHEDSSGNVKYLQPTAVSGQTILAWDASFNAFVFTATKDNDSRTFKLTSFVLPTAGFLTLQIRYWGTTGQAVVKSVKITPTFEGVRNPSEVSKVYETARNYTFVREEELKFSDVVITNSKNWLRIGELPAIVFVEKSLASVPDIIQVPSGAVTQVDQLTDTLVSNSLSFSGGFVNGSYTRKYTAGTGYTIDNILITLSSLSGTPPLPGAEINVTTTVLSATEWTVTITFNNYDYTNEGNIQMQVSLEDSNNNPYQTSTFLFQTLAAGTFTYTQTNISFENQALLGGYSPTLRDCYARNMLSIYNALSYRLEGSFRRKGVTWGNPNIRHLLEYTGYSGVNLQVIGWEYDCASRIAKITFGQIPTAYTYPIN